jgi:hypothetical protein
MGMFDNIYYKGEAYQSKDMECELTSYYIEDGKLFRHQWSHNGEKWVDDGKKETQYHGYLNFYRRGPEKWEEYNAKFDEGNLITVEESQENWI